MKSTPTEELDHYLRIGTPYKLTLEEAVAMGYEKTLVSWANEMAGYDMNHGVLHPRGFPYSKTSSIPKTYLERMGVIATTPEKAFKVEP